MVHSTCELILCPVLRRLSPGWIKSCLYPVISSYGHFFYIPRFIYLCKTSFILVFSQRTLMLTHAREQTCALLKGLVHDNAHVWVLTVADCFSSNRKRIRCMQVNLQNSNSLFATREYFRAFGLILFFSIIQVYSLLLLTYMLQPIRIRFTALYCFETKIYQRVFYEVVPTLTKQSPIGKQNL